jgi:hypothetical protein
LTFIYISYCQNGLEEIQNPFRFIFKIFFLCKVINKMDSYTDDKIKSILNQYKKKRERENNKYHNELKHDEEWKNKNNEKSKQYYHNNKEAVKKKYINNKEYIKIRNLYRYYLREDRINDFKNKYPDKYKYLQNKGYVPIDDKIHVEEKNDIKSFFKIVDENKEIFEEI